MFQGNCGILLKELLLPPAAEQIRTARLEQLKKALRSDTSPIDAIVLRMGFPNPNWAKTVFRKTYGMTISDWRKSGSARP